MGIYGKLYIQPCLVWSVIARLSVSSHRGWTHCPGLEGLASVHVNEIGSYILSDFSDKLLVQIYQFFLLAFLTFVSHPGPCDSGRVRGPKFHTVPTDANPVLNILVRHLNIIKENNNKTTKSLISKGPPLGGA